MLFSDFENANTANGERLMVDLELDDGLAVITIDRPEARNAIAPETMEQLDAALDGAEGATALVVKGAGDRAFVSGGDLKQLAALRTEEDAAAMARQMRGVCDRIANFPGVTVAVLNGHALGGGAEFAVAADIRLAAADIKIGFNQVALEIMPAWGGAERLVELVGYSKALLLAGTGTILSAAEAERVGLIDKVLPRESFDDDWRAIARKLAHRAAGEIKRVMRGASTDEAVEAFARLWVSDEHWAAADKAMNRAK
jgi:enoyl-CoA hydratase/carnithine racemase